MLSHLVSFTKMYHILWIFFLITCLMSSCYSSSNKVLHFKPKNEYFLQTSHIHFNIMFLLLHAFSCQYANTLLFSTLINFCNFILVSLPSFVLKFNKGSNFYQEAKTVKNSCSSSIFLSLCWYFLLSLIQSSVRLCMEAC